MTRLESRIIEADFVEIMQNWSAPPLAGTEPFARLVAPPLAGTELLYLV